LKYIPFAEGMTNRLYKGEGSVQFTAYNPFARSVYKYLDQYNVNNKDEWAAASGMLSQQGSFDTLVGTEIKLYNPGVKETDFILSLQFKNGVIPAGQIYISVDGATRGQLTLKAITPIKEDDEIRINTKLNLIEGYKNGQKTGNIYNRYISAGTFFKIPVSKNIVMYLPQFNYFNNIEYKYIYF
jgi:hypothetical protein